jgi:hypothetical protein
MKLNQSTASYMQGRAYRSSRFLQVPQALLLLFILCKKAPQNEENSRHARLYSILSVPVGSMVVQQALSNVRYDPASNNKKSISGPTVC